MISASKIVRATLLLGLLTLLDGAVVLRATAAPQGRGGAQRAGQPAPRRVMAPPPDRLGSAAGRARAGGTGIGRGLSGVGSGRNLAPIGSGRNLAPIGTGRIGSSIGSRPATDPGSGRALPATGSGRRLAPTGAAERSSPIGPSTPVFPPQGGSTPQIGIVTRIAVWPGADVQQIRDDDDPVGGPRTGFTPRGEPAHTAAGVLAVATGVEGVAENPDPLPAGAGSDVPEFADPADQQPMVTLGRRLLSSGRQQLREKQYFLAESSFHGALSLFPRDPVLHIEYALALLGVDNVNGASAELISGFRIEPDLLTESLNLQAAFGGKEAFDERLELVTRYQQAYPLDSGALFLLGFLELHSGAAVSARERFELLTRNDPHYPFAAAFSKRLEVADLLLEEQEAEAPAEPKRDDDTP